MSLRGQKSHCINFSSISENLNPLETQSECINESHKGRDYPGSYDTWLFANLQWHNYTSEPTVSSSISKNVN